MMRLDVEVFISSIICKNVYTMEKYCTLIANMFALEDKRERDSPQML